MGNGPSRYPNAETVYPQTRPGFFSSRRKHPRAGPDWLPDEADYQPFTEYPQTRPMGPQYLSTQQQQFYPTYAPQPVTVGSIPFAPVMGQPGSAPVVPPIPIIQPTPAVMPQPPVTPFVPGVAMPMPQDVAGNSSAPIYPPPPVIPDLNHPVIPQPMPGTPLAPGQYGRRDSYDSDSSRSPSPESHRQYYHRRGHSFHDYRPRHNPLPEPPKDLFEFSPYVSLLRDLKSPAEEGTFRKHAPSNPRSVLITPVVAQPQTQYMGQGSYPGREKKQKKGLFRSLSSRLAPKPNHHNDIRYAPNPPMFTSADPNVPPVVLAAPPGERTPGGGMQYIYNAPLPGVPEDFQPVTNPGRVPTPVIPGPRTPSPMPVPRAATPAQMPTPVPAPPPPLVLKIEHSGPLSGLVHTSGHSVNFNRKVYPTAYHLWEALKFMDHRPDLAERIRTTGSGPEGVAAAQRIAEEMREFFRPDWNQVAMRMIEEALYHKLVQHPDLRRLLLETGSNGLSFASQDDFWGEGPMGQGLNALGRALVFVRERLRDDGYTLES